MRKLRIMYFQQNLAIGACEEYFYLLMEGIDKTKFDVLFVCPENAVLDSLVTRIKALGVEVHKYSLDTNNYLLILNLVLFFRRFKPDLIHFNDPCLMGIIAARLAGMPVLVMTYHTPELKPKYSLKGRLIKRIAFRHCGLYFIFIAERNREIGIKKDKLVRKRSSVIYYGLPPEKFQQKYDKKEVCQEFLLDGDCRIVGNIGRLSYQKGQSYLIEAAALIIKQVKSVKFFLVGEGELKLELKAQVKEKGLQDYFIFTGHRTDIPRLLSAFEILVMPSLFEGLPFAAIEAAAMGIPVIAANVGGVSSLVIDGKTGLLIPPGDSQALAKAILWMLEHPKEVKEMGLAGQQYFAEWFTQEQMVKKTEELYESILGKLEFSKKCIT